MKKIAFAVLPLAFAIVACDSGAEEAAPVEPMATETPAMDPMAADPMATETPAMDPAAEAAPADEAM